MDITTTRVYDAIQATKKQYIVLEGSTRSSKTYSIIQFLILTILQNPEKPLEILIVRGRLTWLKKTILRDLKDILSKQFNLWDERKHNKSENKYILGNATIHFGGMDSDGGQKYHGAKFDFVWFNEAVELEWGNVQQLLLRLEGRAIFDFNPKCPSIHWLFSEILQNIDNPDYDGDVDYIHSTYKDNWFLSDSIIKGIEKYRPTEENIRLGTADETFWKIYGLGQRATLEGLVFKNYKEINNMPHPKQCDAYGYGADWGHTNDPTTTIECAIFDGALYLNEILYEKGLTNIHNDKNPNQMSIERRWEELGVDKNRQIIGDSSEPKTITDLKNCGYDIEGVTKTHGSVVEGIDMVKSYQIYVTKSSMNLIREFNMYKWGENKNNKTLNNPVDAFNHCMDAVRYFVMYFGTKERNIDDVTLNFQSIEMNTGAEKYDY